MSSYTPANYIKYGNSYLIPIFNDKNYPDTGDTYKPKSYYQNVYNSAVINYNGTNCVYLETSITLTKGLWNVSYNANINLYSNFLTVLFLSSANTSDTNANKINNRLILSQTLNRTNSTSTTTQATRVAYWSGIINVASDTTYYLYAIAASTSSTAATFKISTSSTAPSGITYYKKLGSFVNDGSSNITSIRNDNAYGEFGDWVSKSSNTNYQALTDGYVIAYSNNWFNGADSSPGKRLETYSDSTSTPTILRARVGTTSSTTAIYVSSNVPVKKGDYYRVDDSTGVGSTIYFIPSGS
jgi:hypothetical protein